MFVESAGDRAAVLSFHAAGEYAAGAGVGNREGDGARRAGHPAGPHLRDEREQEAEVDQRVRHGDRRIEARRGVGYDVEDDDDRRRRCSSSGTRWGTTCCTTSGSGSRSRRLGILVLLFGTYHALRRIRAYGWTITRRCPRCCWRWRSSASSRTRSRTRWPASRSTTPTFTVSR